MVSKRDLALSRRLRDALKRDWSIRQKTVIFLFLILPSMYPGGKVLYTWRGSSSARASSKRTSIFQLPSLYELDSQAFGPSPARGKRPRFPPCAAPQTSSAGSRVSPTRSLKKQIRVGKQKPKAENKTGNPRGSMLRRHFSFKYLLILRKLRHISGFPQWLSRCRHVSADPGTREQSASQGQASEYLVLRRCKVTWAIGPDL